MAFFNFLALLFAFLRFLSSSEESVLLLLQLLVLLLLLELVLLLSLLVLLMLEELEEDKDRSFPFRLFNGRISLFLAIFSFPFLFSFQMSVFQVSLLQRYFVKVRMLRMSFLRTAFPRMLAGIFHVPLMIDHGLGCFYF